MAKFKDEIFLPIPEYEGLYSVSNYGRIRSEKRVTLCTNGMLLPIKGKICKNTNVGYKQMYKGCRLYKNGIGESIMVHKLVAMVHMGHEPNGHKMVIDHIDNDRSNNHVSNLQIVTQRENASKNRTGTSKYTGVHWSNWHQKWVAKIVYNKDYIHLGTYDKEIDAHYSYTKALNNINNGKPPRERKKKKK